MVAQVLHITLGGKAPHLMVAQVLHLAMHCPLSRLLA
ncbi:hypothetical protein Golob_012055, partial [Gossypium lobatum]|nr:hypothetical protein [Gossypium lobatum]